VYELDAEAYHYADRSFESWCRTAYDYGQNNVLFARSGLTTELELAAVHFGRRHLLQRLLIRGALTRPPARPLGRPH